MKSLETEGSNGVFARKFISSISKYSEVTRNFAPLCVAFKHHAPNWKNDLSTTLLPWEIPLEVMGEYHSSNHAPLSGNNPWLPRAGAWSLCISRALILQVGAIST